MFKYLLTLFFFLSFLAAGELDIDRLLITLSKEDDLSKKTVKESAGHVIIYTREDLDRMKIKSLKEIIEKIPFMRYNENSMGLADPAFVSFHPYDAKFIKVYVDDTDISDAMGTAGLQLFSELDLNFIDHIEIYIGAVSFNIGIEPSLAIIKLYTKDAARENADVVNLSYATYGTRDINIYSGRDLGDYSYLIYFNHRDLKRKRYSFNDTVLKRDRHTDMFFLKFDKNYLSLKLGLLNGGYDTFLDRAISLEPKDNRAYIKTPFISMDYKKEGLKINLNFFSSTLDERAGSDKYLSLLPKGKIPYLYKNSLHKVKEYKIEGELSKEFENENLYSIAGIKGRQRVIDFELERYGKIDFNKRAYKGDKAAALFYEGKYLFNRSNILLFSYKLDRFYEDFIDNYIRHAYRAGYVYNTKDTTLKLFWVKAAFVPQPVHFIQNEMLSKLDLRLDKERALVYSLEAIKKFDRQKISFIASSLQLKDTLIFNHKKFHIQNRKSRVKAFTSLIRYWYYFDILDKLEFNYFASKVKYSSRYFTYTGGHISLFKRLGEVDTYTSLVYRNGYRYLKSGWDFSISLSYRLDKKLSFYLKGINLFDRALKTNYFGYDFESGKVISLKDVDVIDKMVWIGLEYQF